LRDVGRAAEVGLRQDHQEDDPRGVGAARAGRGGVHMTADVVSGALPPSGSAPGSLETVHRTVSQALASPGYLEPSERARGARMIHPGPRAPERMQAARTRLVPIEGTLRAGETVMVGVARLFAGAGCPGGVVFLDGVTCDPMRYVLPALSPDAFHAA